MSDIPEIPVGDFTRADFEEYETTCIELARKHRELGSLLAVEKEGRVTNYFLSEEKSVSGRDRDAEFQTLNLTTDIIRLRSDIAALEVMCDFYRTWMGASIRGA